MFSYIKNLSYAAIQKETKVLKTNGRLMKV